jgi:hypothetical protein
MKSMFYKQFLIAVIIQLFFTASVFGQKYENGTRLLKGAEVLSATPLQLDYVLEKLADTARITVNLHEGKTHLVLDDGSGKWREWWYCMGKWQVKSNAATGGGVLPDGAEESIQTKDGDRLKGSYLSVKEPGMIYSTWNDGSVGMIREDTVLRKWSSIEIDYYGFSKMSASGYGFGSNLSVHADGLQLTASNYNDSDKRNAIYMNAQETTFLTSGRNENGAYCESEVKIDADGISVTNSALPKGRVTLTEIIQKGQIITSADEPDIPADSFAFWVNGNDFWLILDSGGVQKKLQMLF